MTEEAPRLRFVVQLEWMDGREETIIADGYSVRPDHGFLAIHEGTGVTVRWRIHHLSQFKNVEMQPQKETA